MVGRKEGEEWWGGGGGGGGGEGVDRGTDFMINLREN